MAQDLFDQPEPIDADFESEDGPVASDIVPPSLPAIPEQQGLGLAQQYISLSPSLRVEEAVNVARRIIEDYVPVVLRRCKPKDFVRHSADAAAVLHSDGIKAVAPFFRFHVRPVRSERFPKATKPGEPYRWEVELNAHSDFFGIGVEGVIGVAESTEKYVTGGTRMGEAKTDDNVRQAAFSRAYTRAWGAVTGLKTFTDAELIQAGIDPTKVPGVEYKTPEQKAVAEDLEAKIRQGLIDIGADPSDPSWSGWVYAATCYSMEKDGETQIVAVDSLGKLMKSRSGKWPPVVHGRIKKAIEQIKAGKLEKGQAALDWMRGEGLGTE